MTPPTTPATARGNAAPPRPGAAPAAASPAAAATRSSAASPCPRVAAAAATVIAAVTLAPWALGFSASHAAVAGHVAFAMAFLPVALLLGALRAAAPATAAAGAWLAASPWALGFASLGVTAWSADLVAGAVLIGLARRAWAEP